MTKALCIGHKYVSEASKLVEAFLYYDKPFVYALHFLSSSGKDITVYISVNEMKFIELIKAAPIHKLSSKIAAQWLTRHISNITQIKIKRVYFYPLMYPLLKIEYVTSSGIEEIIFDPEFRKIVSEEKLKQHHAY